MARKKLASMTWADVQSEMSLAGSPEKMAALGKQIIELIGAQYDTTNRAELTNVEFMLQRILAEIRLWQKLYDKSH